VDDEEIGGEGYDPAAVQKRMEALVVSANSASASP
jgi:hypothetical protein